MKALAPRLYLALPILLSLTFLGCPPSGQQYVLNVYSAGVSNASITSSTGHAGSTHYTTLVASGANVSLTAPATVSGRVFTGWTGDVTSSNETIGFLMASPKTVTANYEPGPPAVLHSFAGGTGDGKTPYGSLTPSGSVLYGMTQLGGTADKGVVFRLNQDGTGYTILHHFSGGNGAGEPLGSLTLSGSTLYGVTFKGGTKDFGAVFSMNVDGTEYTVLHSFDGAPDDGAFGYGSLTLSGSTLYGITSGHGSHSAGVVFSVKTDGSDYTILHDFAGGPGDGQWPVGAVTVSGSNIYGVTSHGGLYGAGILFRMNTDGT
ncbi:MAG: choice-of-anchor tandem repeat GloVer-containing protein, partial [Candidatus Hydrogenedentales bacterium]